MASTLPTNRLDMHPQASEFKLDLHPCEPDRYNQLIKYLRPGGCSGEGFISETEDPREVCLRDSAFLAERNITHKQIGDCLDMILLKIQHLTEKAISQGKFPSAVLIRGFIKIPTHLSTGGEQECPFSADVHDRRTWCGKGSSMINIFNTINESVLKDVTELSGHLIRDHHFFEGDVPWRICPEIAIKVLDIKPGVDYSCKILEERTWKMKSTQKLQNDMLDRALMLCEKFPSEKLTLDGGGVAFIFAFKDLDDYEFVGLTLREKIIQEGKKNNISDAKIEEKIKFAAM